MKERLLVLVSTGPLPSSTGPEKGWKEEKYDFIRKGETMEEKRGLQVLEKILSNVEEKMLLGENRVGSQVLVGLCWLLLPGARGGAAPEWATVRNAQPQGHCTLHTA